MWHVYFKKVFSFVLGRFIVRLDIIIEHKLEIQT